MKIFFVNILKIIIKKGLKPQLHILENEDLNIFKDYITEQHVSYQLKLAILHRHSCTGSAIQTFKNHFLAGL